MKYICLGYIEPGKFQGMTEDERRATFDECFEYDDHLRANGHLVAEVSLQPPETALTLHWKNGKVAMTDGRVSRPFNCAQGRLFAFFAKGRVPRTPATAKLRRPDSETKSSPIPRSPAPVQPHR
ncbi:MAG: YciI family protein, partial [Bdellovibrionota bacterium]